MVTFLAMRRIGTAARMARAEGSEAFHTTAGVSATVAIAAPGVIMTGAPVPKTAVLKSATFDPSRSVRRSTTVRSWSRPF
jgi:hypothetical protein